MREAEMFIIHPDTGETYSISEASGIIGVSIGVLYGRLSRGDKGMQIWRPAHTRACTVRPGKLRSATGYIKCTGTETFYV